MVPGPLTWGIPMLQNCIPGGPISCPQDVINRNPLVAAHEVFASMVECTESLLCLYQGRLNHPPAQGKSRCVFNKAHKQPQCTCQDREQFDTTCSLISAPQWHHTPLSGLS